MDSYSAFATVAQRYNGAARVLVESLACPGRCSLCMPVSSLSGRVWMVGLCG